MIKNSILITTLGCKVNQYDSGALREIFLAKGFTLSGDSVDGDPEGSDPDVVIINTCIVSSESERKSRQAIRKMRARYPKALLAVVGCYPQRFPEQVAAIEGIDFVTGISGHEALAGRIKSFLVDNRALGRRSNAGTRAHTRTRMRTRAYIKIQDGCDNFCSYCIVPYTRGRARNRTLNSIIGEVEKAVSSGAPEIVLTGIHISSYCSTENVLTELPGRKDATAPGYPYAGESSSAPGYLYAGESTAAPGDAYSGIKPDLPDSMSIVSSGCDYRPGDIKLGELIDIVSKRLRVLSQPQNPVRLRLSSLEPTVVTPAFVDCLAENRDVLCPHFHLSLQSGSDTVLRRMNRRYTQARYKEAVSLLRGQFPDAGITTDVIAGFPGESEAEYSETYRFCREIAFSKIHVFPYSIRPGTKAADLPDQVAPSIKRDRAGRLIALSDELSLDFHRGYVGKDIRVLVENIKAGYIIGLTGNYIRVRAHAPAARYSPEDSTCGDHVSARGKYAFIRGRYASFRVTDATPSHVTGELIL